LAAYNWSYLASLGNILPACSKKWRKDHCSLWTGKSIAEFSRDHAFKHARRNVYRWIEPRAGCLQVKIIPQIITKRVRHDNRWHRCVRIFELWWPRNKLCQCLHPFSWWDRNMFSREIVRPFFSKHSECHGICSGTVQIHYPIGRECLKHGPKK